MEPRRRLRRCRKRKREEHAAPSGTSIASLGDDLLAEFLLRLPSLASLVRAALVCVRWRRLAATRDFIRSFRSRHPSPPLLGCFASSAPDRFIAFHRAHVFSDKDLAATVRGGDFLLTGMKEDKWCLRDCRQGFLLFASRDKLSLFNPVSRRRIIIRQATDSDFAFHSCFLPVCSGDRLTSFRLVSLENSRANLGRVRAHVYSSHTGKWRSYPWAPPSIKAPAPRWLQDQPSLPSMHAAGRIYWKYQKGNLLLSLDTAPGGSMEFSHVALPPVPDLYRTQAPFVVGDTEDGACCLVCVVQHDEYFRVLQVWLRNEEAGSWELETQIHQSSFQVAGGRPHLSKVYQVCAVTAGVVLLSLSCEHKRHRYLTFRLKNLDAGPGAGELPLEADFFSCSWLAAYPFLMAWPSSTLLPRPRHRIRQEQNNGASISERHRTAPDNADLKTMA